MLKEWLIHYVKNKDILQKKIVKIEDTDFGIKVHTKVHLHNYIIIDDLSKIQDIKSELNKNKGGRTSLVVLNTKKNYDIVVSNWKTMVEFDPHFSIIFANPKALIEKKWIVFPHTHNSLSEDYKLGLKSLFDTVETVS